MLNTKKLLQGLLENNVDFILVGGLAAVAYGASTLTQDLDVCFNFDTDNIRQLLKALEDLNPRVRAGSKNIPLGDDVQRLSQYNNLYIKTDWGDLDLLGQIKGLGDYPQVEKHAIAIEIFGCSCRILDIDSLIKSKEVLDRPKDRQVVLELKVIKEELKK